MIPTTHTAIESKPAPFTGFSELNDDVNEMDVCFDAQRRIGCYLCPQYDCELRDV